MLSCRTVRLVEIRLLEGPNVYRLEPVVKLELALGRRRTWYGQRQPGRHAIVHLGAAVPARDWPDPVAAIVAWVRRLRVGHGEGRGGVAVHRSSDPGHWIVTFPWSGEERARRLTEAALALAERDVSPSRTAQLTGAQERLVARWTERIADARSSPPTWIRDRARRMPVISISGTNGKSTVTRLITHVLMEAGHHVGTTTSDGVLVDERLIEPGDWTGPGGAHHAEGAAGLLGHLHGPGQLGLGRGRGRLEAREGGLEGLRGEGHGVRGVGGGVDQRGRALERLAELARGAREVPQVHGPRRAVERVRGLGHAVAVVGGEARGRGRRRDRAGGGGARARERVGGAGPGDGAVQVGPGRVPGSTGARWGVRGPRVRVVGASYPAGGPSPRTRGASPHGAGLLVGRRAPIPA